jgi:murein DD-endopeptidase MepM/ murein hydrolase activator NlpD
MRIDLRSKQGLRNFKLAHLLVASLLVVLMVGGYFFYQWLKPNTRRFLSLRAWFQDPQAHQDWAIQAGQRCGEAPFLMPTNGYIGFLWGDAFRPGHRHQGLDIFGGGGLNETPVVAAYSGYLTRRPDWKSSLIQRLPDDPLQPGRQIWIYYTHMADKQGHSFIDPAFPPGTAEVYVEAGTLLGYQGNFSGDPINPTGIHLHFSIVRDQGGQFLNELEIRNTLDPSPYLGLPLNGFQNKDEIPVCKQADG